MITAAKTRGELRKQGTGVIFRSIRAGAFVVVGALGLVIQLATWWAFTRLGHWPVLVATALSVELAVLHNFLWHERWTWSDRTSGQKGAATRCARYHVTVGVTSVVGNVALMWASVDCLGIDATIATPLTVAVMAAANFFAADRLVFATDSDCHWHATRGPGTTSAGWTDRAGTASCAGQVRSRYNPPRRSSKAHS